MPSNIESLPFLAHLPLRARRMALRALWQGQRAIGRAPALGLEHLLTSAIRVPRAEARRLDAEIGFQDLLSTLEWAALIARNRPELESDAQRIVFDAPALLHQLAGERKPLIFAPLHMGCYALPFAKMMKDYFPDRPMLILRARDDMPEETLAMQRIGEIGIDMRFLNVREKQNYFDAVRFARAGAIIVNFVDLPASYGGAVPIMLFGKSAKLAMGINSLARVTGATVVPLSVHSSLASDVVHLGRPFESYETGPDEKIRVARLIRCHIEQSILAAPEQWHMWPRFHEFTDVELNFEAA